MPQSIIKVIHKVKENNPLVHCITNYVTVNDCANILLSLGASPAMCEAQEEVADFVGISGSLYLNIGTLTSEQKESMRIAAKTASHLGTPIVIDPVGAGALKSRHDFILELLENNKISIIKGNLGEIKTLAGFDTCVKGVDSIDNGENGIEACKVLAQRYQTVVAATGKVDVITDGKRVCLIENGHLMLTKVTGAGCMIGALAGATAAVEADYFLATAAAVGIMGIVGEITALGGKNQLLPGTFRIKLFDNIYQIHDEEIKKVGKLKWL